MLVFGRGNLSGIKPVWGLNDAFNTLGVATLACLYQLAFVPRSYPSGANAGPICSTGVLKLSGPFLPVSLLVLGLTVGWTLKSWKVESDAALALRHQLEQQEHDRQLVAQITDKTLAAINQIRITNTTIYQKTRHEITKEPMPADCRIPASWMQQLNAARAAKGD